MTGVPEIVPLRMAVTGLACWVVLRLAVASTAEVAYPVTDKGVTEWTKPEQVVSMIVGSAVVDQPEPVLPMSWRARPANMLV
jgi:hypothetical protein